MEARAEALDGKEPGEAPAVPVPTWRRRLRVAATVAVLVAGVAWALHGVGIGTLGTALAGARPGWVALAAAVNLVAVLLQAARWLALVRPLRPFSSSATLGAAFKSMVVGSTVSMFIPVRGGEVARIQWFARRTGLARAPLVGSVVLDYVVNAAGLLLGLAVLPFVFSVPPWIVHGVVLTVALFAVGGLVVFAGRPAAEGCASPRRCGPIQRVLDVLARVRGGLVAMGDPAALGRSFAASIGAWMVELVVIATTMKALAINAPLSASLVVLLAVNLALAIPFAPPANAGTLEMGASLALMGFGVAKEAAIAFAVLYHLLQIVPIVALGTFFAGRAASGVRTDAPAPA